jgi:hypothetical protein
LWFRTAVVYAKLNYLFRAVIERLNVQQITVGLGDLRKRRAETIGAWPFKRGVLTAARGLPHRVQLRN